MYREQYEEVQWRVVVAYKSHMFYDGVTYSQTAAFR